MLVVEHGRICSYMSGAVFACCRSAAANMNEQLGHIFLSSPRGMEKERSTSLSFFTEHFARRTESIVRHCSAAWHQDTSSI